jgi:hypothetical protein
MHCLSLAACDWGATWKLITKLTGTGSYNYTWLVPPESSATCMVKVVLKDANGYILGKDTSDSFFTIQP